MWEKAEEFLVKDKYLRSLVKKGGDISIFGEQVSFVPRGYLD